MSSSAERRSGFVRFILCVLIIAALGLSSACAGSTRRAGLKPSIKRDVIERAPVGLRMDVTKFTWQYIRGGSGLQVNGTVRNSTRKTQAPVVLYAMLFDEGGRAVGMGETRITPSTLAPGAQGTFTLVVGTSRPQKPRPIRHLRLLSNFQNN